MKSEMSDLLVQAAPTVSPREVTGRLADWLADYNGKRPGLGWPNYGLHPADVIDSYVRDKG